MCECQNKQEYRYDEQEIVDYVKMNCASNTELPSRPYQEYTKDELVAFVQALLVFVMVILARLGVKKVEDLQERLDQLVFSANKFYASFKRYAQKRGKDKERRTGCR